jgi:hypothetical protein
VKATLAAEQDVFNAACVPASADCSPHLKDLVDAADKLRTAMHADSAGPAFFSDAYAMIDKLDDLRNNYEPLDQAGTRGRVLMLADQLSTWVRQHPTQ